MSASFREGRHWARDLALLHPGPVAGCAECEAAAERLAREQSTCPPEGSEAVSGQPRANGGGSRASDTAGITEGDA